MKPRFWRSDWFLGLAVLAAFAAFNGFSDLIPSLERKAYDLGLAATSRTPPKDDGDGGGNGAKKTPEAPKTSDRVAGVAAAISGTTFTPWFE